MSGKVITSKALESDPEFLATVNRQRGRVLSFVLRMLRDQAEAEDVLQEVLAEYVEAQGLGAVIESAGAWLSRVARNKVLDRFRKRKTQAAHKRLVEGEAPENLFPANEWMRDWMRAEIADAIGLLPPEQREVFVRHELEGESFQKIAAETGVPLNTLLSRKRYAVLALREYLKEVYDELE